MDPMLRCAGLMLKIKAMITDQRLLVAAFHAADLRHGEKVSHGFISVCTPWYTGRKLSVHHKDKFNGHRSLVIHTATGQNRKERAYIDRGSGWKHVDTGEKHQGGLTGEGGGGGKDQTDS